MKTLITSIAALGILTLLFFSGRNGGEITGGATQNKAAAASALAAPEESFSFGEISMKDGKVAHTFTLANTGSSTAEIRDISTSCMCTEAFLLEGEVRQGPFGMPGHGGRTRLSEGVPAGENRTLEVIFDPAAHGPAGIGNITRGIFIEDATGAVTTLEIRATVTP